MLLAFCLLHSVTGFVGIVRFISSPQLLRSSQRTPSVVGLSSVVDNQERQHATVLARSDDYKQPNDHSINFDPSWSTARNALRDPGCCVVSVVKNGSSQQKSDSDEDQHSTKSLKDYLKVLRERLAVHGPSDIDIRTRIDTTSYGSATKDCVRVCQSMLLLGKEMISKEIDDTAEALAELAMGMSSFAKDCSSPNNDDDGVFLRIVCASSYGAHDPVFHTDKAPLRGYTTLEGVGTEFVTHPCSPLEYLALRSFGMALPRFGNQQQQTKNNSHEEDDTNLRCASEGEFIVMKGDYYYRGNPDYSSSWWRQREFACVHRSPPGSSDRGSISRRRVIVSFDLADGDDDREWHDANQKRTWRAGMTQRKSKLVA